MIIDFKMTELMYNHKLNALTWYSGKFKIKDKQTALKEYNFPIQSSSA